MASRLRDCTDHCHQTLQPTSRQADALFVAFSLPGKRSRFVFFNLVPRPSLTPGTGIEVWDVALGTNLGNQENHGKTDRKT